MHTNNTKNEVVGVVRAYEIAFLSITNLDNFPETRALFNVLNKAIDDKLELYFATDANSSKIEQIRENNHASLYHYNEGIMKNMTLFGKLEIITDKTLKTNIWHDSFGEYYKNGKDDGSYGEFIPIASKYYTHESGDSQKKTRENFKIFH
ncbi:MAG: pyridoxamine 5'-phosphate oxidase family protein [Puniceicoccales bacterium]|jgi:general stress protein 26|nr:pyridoxamine 5'-phosphate oxidase family protein [Puniceicoccales bacterium]